MRKNTGTRTATTFTLVAQHPNFRNADADLLAAIGAPYIWKDETGAREAVELMDTQGHEHSVHFAPGLEVHAWYVNGALLTVIVFEDDTVSRLHRAVRKQFPVTLTYVTAEGEETVRTIEPRSVQATKGGDVIVKALDRKSGLHRSFRADRIRAYTLHRTAFTVGEPVRVEDPETGKAKTVSAADYAERQARLLKPRRVRHTRHGYAGRTVPGTRAYGPGGWSVVVELEDAGRTPSGTTRASEDELVEIAPAPLPTFYVTDPETAARWDDEALLGHLAEAWATGHTLAQL